MHWSPDTICTRLQFYTMPSEQQYPFANDKMLQEHLYKINYIKQSLYWQIFLITF